MIADWTLRAVFFEPRALCGAHGVTGKGRPDAPRGAAAGRANIMVNGGSSRPNADL